MKRLLIAFGLVAAALYLVKWFNKPRNDLSDHLKEQAALDNMQQVSTAVDNTALAQFPLSTMGEQPYTGFDVANYQFGAAADNMPQGLQLFPRAPGSIYSDPSEFRDSLIKQAGGYW